MVVRPVLNRMDSQLLSLTVCSNFSALAKLISLVSSQVREKLEDLLVAPGDFIALQHDAGPSGLLSCSPDPSSPWKQSFLVQNRSEWLSANETAEVGGDGEWAKDFVCQIRVLYVGQNETRLQGPFLSAGLPQTGEYSLEVTSNHPDATASCPIHVIPPLGLAVIHPASRNGTVYFPPNQTSILVKVRSQQSVALGCRGTNKTVAFQSTCPPALAPSVPECRAPSPANDSLFAWLDLELGSTPGQTSVRLHAQSEVTEAELEIQARVEEPLRGLRVQPHPSRRVLMESVVVR